MQKIHTVVSFSERHLAAIAAQLSRTRGVQIKRPTVRELKRLIHDTINFKLKEVAEWHEKQLARGTGRRGKNGKSGNGSDRKKPARR